MSPQDLAALLNGREYTKEITDDEANAAFDAGLVVVFGASDDLMEFRGKIDDEISCYDGGTAFLNSAGLLKSECEDDDCPYFQKELKAAATIDAVFGDVVGGEEGYTWTYKTDVPHATFDILEDGEKYCRGIVFRLADVNGVGNANA